MDLGTTAAVFGIVAAVVYVADTAYRCGSALLEKFTLLKKIKATTTLKDFQPLSPMKWGTPIQTFACFVPTMPFLKTSVS
jgi:hypothetical protein